MAKPVVDGIERELGQARLVRLNVGSKKGGEIAGRYAVRRVPTLYVIDGQGEPVLWQVGRIDKKSVLDAVAHSLNLLKF